MDCFPGDADVYCRATNPLAVFAPVSEGDRQIDEVNKRGRLSGSEIVRAVLEVGKHGSKGWLAGLGGRFGVWIEQAAGRCSPVAVFRLSQRNGDPEGFTGAPEEERAVLLRKFVESLAGSKASDFSR
jgi:hypothetical protein